jgi:hypothetical protein
VTPTTIATAVDPRPLGWYDDLPEPSHQAWSGVRAFRQALRTPTLRSTASKPRLSSEPCSPVRRSASRAATLSPMGLNLELAAIGRPQLTPT